MQHRSLMLGLFTGLAIGLAGIVATAAPIADVLARPAERRESVDRAVFLSITRAGGRLVAVGERGVAALSDDNGRTWRQVAMPVSVSLTVVHFATPAQGWIAGHGGVILHTADGGAHWALQMDGLRAAQLVVEEARQSGAPSLVDAERLVADGADKPFLDLTFSDARHGFAVGANGLFFETRDGGEHWSSAVGQLDNPKGLHLYAIDHAGNTVVIAGEQGIGFWSRDGGQTFSPLETGSHATILMLAPVGGGFLAGGLKGKAMLLEGPGQEPRPSSVVLPISFNRSVALDSGRIVCVNQAGRLMVSRDDGRSFQMFADPHGAPVVAAAYAADGTLVAAGFGGIQRLEGLQ